MKPEPPSASLPSRGLRPGGGVLEWLVSDVPWKRSLARARAEGKKLPPYPLGNPGLDQLRRFLAGRLQFVLAAAARNKDAFAVRVPWLYATMLIHPEAVRHVLQQRHDNYGKQTDGYDQLRLLVGNGLFTSEGSFWLRQRRIAQPAFHRQRVTSLGESMVRAGEDLVASWSATGDGERDIAREMVRVTLRIVTETLFGRDASADADAVGQAMTTLLGCVQARINMPISVPLDWPTPVNRRFKQAAAVVDRVVLNLIRERRQAHANGVSGTDLLSLLMEARDEETGERMDDEQLRDEAVTMLVGGHETSANALTWTFQLLSRHPSVRRRLHEELANVLGGRSPTVDDLPRLEWTRMVVLESLRLYPPLWILGRNAIEDDEVYGFFVPGQTLVFISPYLTHRHPDFWDNPEVFDPERFSPERSAGRPAFAYIPFGAGPRLCIGNNFSMIEVQLLLATIAQRVELDLVSDAQAEPEPVLTLRPRGGLPMRIKRRS